MSTQTSRRFAPAVAALHPWRAFLLALLLYLFLSFREVSAWTKPVWMMLAFGVIPVIAAFALGRGETARERIRASFPSAGWAMALYTGFHLIRLHRGIGSTGDAGTGINVFLVEVVVATVYGLAAGAVCALAGQFFWGRAGAKGAGK